MSSTRKTPGLRAAIAIAAAAGLTLFSVTPAQAAPNDPIAVPDAALLTCINDDLGQGNADSVTEAQAGGITELDCSGDGVSDLAGLEYLTSLVTLNLDDNNITDVSPLASLTDLEKLYLDDNNISDASPLGSLASLERLHAKRNNITDVTPLGSLTSLQFLRLSANGASDVSPLASLTSLRQLNLTDNDITDVTPLAGMSYLNLLRLDRNAITDLSPLLSLHPLSLGLANNGITDISQLSGLSGVQDLSLEDNMITDVSPLAGISSLRDLSLMRNHITDISPLNSSPATVWAANQSIDLGEIVVDTVQPNPVIGFDGQPVALDNLYDAATNTFTPTSTGTGMATWGFIQFGGALEFIAVEADVAPADVVTVTKSVDASFERVHDWALAKSAEVDEVTVDGDEASADVDYTVTATPGDYRDDYYMLTGEITVTNETVEALPFTVTDTPDVGVDATCDVTLDGDPAEDVTISGAETVIFDYSCDLTSAPEDGTNTATVSWFDGEEEASVTEDVVFSQQEANFESITVVDDQTTPDQGWQTLGGADWNADGTPTQFTYTLTHDGLVTGECTSFTNVAMINETEQTTEATVKICPEAAAAPVPEVDPAPEAETAPTLPKTGADVKTASAAALLLLITGGATLMLRRRQQN